MVDLLGARVVLALKFSGFLRRVQSIFSIFDFINCRLISGGAPKEAIP